jgi:hypothetical protein
MIMHRFHRNPNAAPPAAPRRRKRPRPTWLTATLVELDPPGARLVVRVEDAAVPRLRAGDELVVTTRGSRLVTYDADGDGRVGLTDLFPGDRLRLEVEVDAGGGLRARRVRRLGPAGPVGGLRRLWSGAQRSRRSSSSPIA